MEKPIECKPSMTSVMLCFYEMMLRDAKKYNVTFESIKKTFVLGKNGIATWDVPIKK